MVLRSLQVCRGGFGCKFVLGAIASAAAVVVLIALCAAAYFRAAPSQLASRRLSEGRLPESKVGHAACGETSKEGTGDDSQAPLQEEELLPPQAKNAKVENEGFDADAEAVSEARAPAGGQEVPYSVFASADATAPVTQSLLESSISPEEVIAAQALVALWGEQVHAFPERAALGPVFRGHARPALDHQQRTTVEQELPALAALKRETNQQQTKHAPSQQQGQLPPALQQQAHLLPDLQQQVVLPSASQHQAYLPPAPQQQLAIPRPVRPPDEPSKAYKPEMPSGSREKFLSSNKGLEEIDPMGDWDLPSGDASAGRAALEHPFSRLPEVQLGDTSAYRSFFSPQRAFNNKGVPMQLGREAEVLVGHLTFNETRQPADWPGYAAEVLSFRFLLLDITVCSLQLLGVPRSGPRWDLMVSRIPDENKRPFKKWDKALPKFNVNIMTRLTAAMRTLKGGHRSPAERRGSPQTLPLLLQTSPHSFPEACVGLLEADKHFYLQFEGRRGQSDCDQPGASHQSASEVNVLMAAMRTTSLLSELYLPRAAAESQVFLPFSPAVSPAFVSPLSLRFL
ncbi:hypothetical protein ACSSS7_000395 [Eimeria intestinalis]